jgi:hypothetical protein
MSIITALAGYYADDFTLPNEFPRAKPLGRNRAECLLWVKSRH